MDIVRVQHRDHHTRVNDAQRDSSRSLSNAPRGHNVGNAPDKLVELVVDPADNDAARTVGLDADHRARPKAGSAKSRHWHGHLIHRRDPRRRT